MNKWKSLALPLALAGAAVTHAASQQQVQAAPGNARTPARIDHGKHMSDGNNTLPKKILGTNKQMPQGFGETHTFEDRSANKSPFPPRFKTDNPSQDHGLAAPGTMPLR